MAEITIEESWRQIRALTDQAEQAAADGEPDEAAERCRVWVAIEVVARAATERSSARQKCFIPTRRDIGPAARY